MVSLVFLFGFCFFEDRGVGGGVEIILGIR